MLELCQFVQERGRYENSDFSPEGCWLDSWLANPSFGCIPCDVHRGPDRCFFLALFLDSGDFVRALFLASAKGGARLFLESFFVIFLGYINARVAQMVRARH